MKKKKIVRGYIVAKSCTKLLNETDCLDDKIIFLYLSSPCLYKFNLKFSLEKKKEASRSHAYKVYY